MRLIIIGFLLATVLSGCVVYPYRPVAVVAPAPVIVGGYWHHSWGDDGWRH